MPRSIAPKEQDPQPKADPVSLLGPPADVPQPVSKEIVIGAVESRPTPAASPAPVVTTDSNGNIVIN
jgi:hypothetical protein